MITMSNRSLAHIEQILKIEEIPNAQNIEVATILGWKCVVKKGEFKVGEKIIYIEVDSVVPERPEFEFLRDRKFRIRTIRLKGQISQGLIVHLSTLWNYSNLYVVAVVWQQDGADYRFVNLVR